MDMRNLFYIIPVMVYYFFESLIAGLFINVIWKYFLSESFNIYVTYFQWVLVIWIIKVIFFDVFKLMAGINNAVDNNNKQSDYGIHEGNTEN